MTWHSMNILSSGSEKARCLEIVWMLGSAVSVGSRKSRQLWFCVVFFVGLFFLISVLYLGGFMSGTWKNEETGRLLTLSHVENGCNSLRRGPTLL